jgi:hypothetical protein
MCAYVRVRAGTAACGADSDVQLLVQLGVATSMRLISERERDLEFHFTLTDLITFFSNMRTIFILLPFCT